MNDPVDLPLADLSPGAPFLILLALAAALGLLIHALLLRRFGGDRLDFWTRWIEGTIFSLFLAGMLVLSGLQVVLRNFFHGGLLWIDPLVRTLVLWVAFLGALAATSQARHLHIDVIPRILPPKAGRIVGRILSIVAAMTCGLLANGSYSYLRDEYLYGISPFLGLPSWAVQSILLWGFWLLTYRFLIQAIWPAPRPETP